VAPRRCGSPSRDRAVSGGADLLAARGAKLKEAGLVDMKPRAQERLYELRAQPLRELHDWLERYRRVWEQQRFEELDELVHELSKKEKSDHGCRKGR
jgi:hypothetical protein